MKDAIDKRNEQDRMARTIVKRRNIIYTSKEELERREREEREQKMRNERRAAEEVVKKLKDDANNKMAMEIQRLIADREMLERQLQTGMDATGKKPMNEVTQERVEAILSEKNKMLQDLIAAHSVDSAPKAETVEAAVPEADAADESPAERAVEETSIPVPETDASEAGQNLEAEEQDAYKGPKVVQEERMEEDEY
ncbi:MAG: hypothetical protein HFI69_08640 [Lachnospiraceae bacterium]|nr:hypothetical protein [Lachnospiraceae bacterium]